MEEPKPFIKCELCWNDMINCAYVNLVHMGNGHGGYRHARVQHEHDGPCIPLEEISEALVAAGMFRQPI